MTTCPPPPSLPALLERHLPMLQAYVRNRLGPDPNVRDAAGDVVQSVCRQVLATRSAFEFRGEERFRAWLCTAARNKVREKHRAGTRQRRDRARERPLSDDGHPSAAAFFVTPSEEAIGRETAVAIETALALLSEEHREVVALARIARLPHRAIAEIMGRSAAATRKLLGRAILALAEHLERHGVDLECWQRP
ncbi:MAG: sigma-70 family RNA polymerase sigma factor [Planctomycetes bacterium]|nr:sigma-70 family RNA polymerase sigma factor [Planctomycetota bacterium]